ncbi:MAG: urease accessory protein UreE [Myxococcota bacterium]
MKQYIRRSSAGCAASASITLPFDIRSKSRFRARCDDGTEVGVVLDRGHILRDGDVLADEHGDRVVIRAALERTSTVRAYEGRALGRACYHLGNRHVPLEIGDGWARYRHDHVLDDMLRSLGFAVEVGDTPFEPEGGAYGNHHHEH